MPAPGTGATGRGFYQYGEGLGTQAAPNNNRSAGDATALVRRPPRAAASFQPFGRFGRFGLDCFTTRKLNPGYP
jgi:hypothetical protein